MSLDHAILGFLSYEPMSGYDLKKLFDQSVAHFWPADQSQIYRTLTRMERDGWLTLEVIPKDSRPPRKVYHLTPAGREELGRWLSNPLPPDETRLAWLIQLFFAGRASDENVLRVLEHQAAVQRGRIQRYQAIPTAVQDEMEEDEDPREYFYWMLTSDYGLAQARSQLAWLEQVMDRIRRQSYQLPSLSPYLPE